MNITTLSLVALALAAPAPADEENEGEESRARVFIEESDSWSMGDELSLPGLSDGYEIVGGARPQTAEIVKTLHERCPELIVTRKEERADYVLVLQHEGGKIILRKDNKYAVYHADGDAIASGSTRLLGNSVKEACEAMRADWRDRSGER